MTAYYNENDPKAAAWLRELIKEGHIAHGEVDERSIEDVYPNDLRGFIQCHFFAGIGGWSYALRLAGVPDDYPVWTGSCPCQPFSAAGKGAGFADERHLWPAFHWLIRQCRPQRVFGEQVASAMQWIDLVQRDLEAEGYTCGYSVLGAHSVGAPHIRQRLYWVAESDGGQRDGFADGEGRQRDGAQTGRQQSDSEPAARSASGELGNADDAGPQGRRIRWDGAGERTTWTADLVSCRDGKWRPVEPLAQQMAHGLSVAMGCVRSLGDAEKGALLDAAQSTGLAAETLSAVREGNDPAALWRTIGGRVGFPGASILLALLCEYSGELGIVFYGATPGSAQVSEADLRAVREGRPFAGSPPRRGLSEQSARELTDLVSKVSQKCPSLAAFNGSPLSAGVPGRVGLLRGYGNAIVPQVAAAFIKAALSV